MFKKSFYKLYKLNLFYNRNLSNIREYFDSCTGIFFKEDQKKFNFKTDLAIEWINQSKITKKSVESIVAERESIAYILNVFFDRLEEFNTDFKSKDEFELTFMIQIFKFVEIGLQYGIFKYSEI